MIYFLALIPATGLVIGGYLAFYLSGRSEGGMRTFGKYLGFWAFTLAALVILGAIFAAAHGRRHRMIFIRSGVQGYMRGGPWPGGPGFFGPPMGPYRYGPGRVGPNGSMPRPPGAAPDSSGSSSSTSTPAP
ncbi:MAG TPA: hypothetical protein VMU67_03110 [Steroidobacteraceae bacterium]|nr:hypothetical protein [Steroidobacteraceae bacterium]